MLPATSFTFTGADFEERTVLDWKTNAPMCFNLSDRDWKGTNEAGEVSRKRSGWKCGRSSRPGLCPSYILQAKAPQSRRLHWVGPELPPGRRRDAMDLA